MEGQPNDPASVREGRPIRIVTFSTLFPNAVQPVNGVFVENRLHHLVSSGQVEATVVAPIPWFPSANPRFGRWAELAAIPPFELRHGIRIWHPRFPVIPKVGMSMAPSLMYLWTRMALRRLQAEADFDLIDADMRGDGVEQPLANKG